MTIRCRKIKAVAELVSGEFEASVAENSQSGNLIVGPSKTLRVEPENLDEINTSLRKEIMSDLTKILAKNQKERYIMVPHCTFLLSHSNSHKLFYSLFPFTVVKISLKSDTKARY